MTVLSAPGHVTPAFVVEFGRSATVAIAPTGFGGRAWLQRRIGNQWQNELDASFATTYTITTPGYWRGRIETINGGTVSVEFALVPLPVGTGTGGGVGEQGPPGKSAFQLAQEVDGFSGTLQEYLLSLHGTDGNDGDPGLNAFELAQQLGFGGDLAAWLDSLKGQPGQDGQDGAKGDKGDQGPPGSGGGGVDVTSPTFMLAGESPNIRPAIGRAIAAGHKNLSVPDGDWTLSSPIAAVEHLSIQGMAFGSSTNTAAPKITCSGDFIVNTNTTPSAASRKRVFLRNLHVVGPGTGAGINGAFGGRWEGLVLDNFPDLVLNPSAFLLRIERCSFYRCNFGINFSDTNETEVIHCFWDASCQVAMSQEDVVTFSGGQNGFPLIVRGGNCNVSSSDGLKNKVSFKLRAGMVKFVDMYWEDYSPSGQVPTGNECLHLTVGRFDDGSFEISGCEINGQSKGDTKAVRLISNHTSGSPTNGIITRNRMLGHGGGVPIVFGHPTTPGLNWIEGVRIFDNYPDTFSGFNPAGVYKPMMHSARTTNLTISGATPVTVPINSTVYLDNGSMVNGNAIRARKVGLYRYLVVVTVATTGADYPDCQVTWEVGGSIIKTIPIPLTFAKDPRRTVTFHGIVEVPSISSTQNFVLRAMNGQVLEYASAEIEYLGTGWQ